MLNLSNKLGGKKGIVSILLIGLLVVLPQAAVAQLKGAVYQDYNYNGVFNTATTSGQAVDTHYPGVTVTVYDNTGAVVGSTTTTQCINSNATNNARNTLGTVVTAAICSGTGTTGPNYTITPTGSGPYKIEFTGYAAPFYPSFGGGSATQGDNVQFAATGNATINFGLVLPADYCQNNPNLCLPAWFLNDPQPVGSSASQNGALVRFKYDNSGFDTSLATTKQIGTTWGLAYQRSSKKLFTSAVLRRHAAMPPDGSGAIYVINNANAAVPSAPTLFVDVKTIGIDTGALANPRNLPTNTFTYSQDAEAAVAAAKMGIGDIDMGDDDASMWLTNLKDRTVYRLQVGKPAVAPTAANVTGFTQAPWLTTNPCTLGLPRPWATKAYRGRMYVGVVCTGESEPVKTENPSNPVGPNISNANLQGLVYSIAQTAGNTGAAWALELQHPLNYRKGYTVTPGNHCFSIVAGGCESNSNEWWAWADASTTAGDFNTMYFKGATPYLTRPMPILMDIEFDRRGDMILAYGDRAGLVMGANNLDTAGTLSANGIAAGDILKACKSAGVWVLESAGTCGGITTTQGGGGEGPGGGEFYAGDYGPGGPTVFHAETMQGGLAQVPGFVDVPYAAMDPVGVFSGGVTWVNNDTGVKVTGRTITQSFQKANGLGDLEALCDLAPVQVGNQVWIDTNNNGIQDAGEPPVAGVTVRLYDTDGTTVLATAVTDALGRYYFSNKTAESDGTAIAFPGAAVATVGRVDAIPNFNTNTNGYVIRFDKAADYLPGGPLYTYSLTTPKVNIAGSSDINDSDAILPSPGSPIGVGNFPAISFNLGAAGENNPNLDAGFYNNSFAIGNRVWFDTNNDGLISATENGISGVKVQLLDSTSTVVQTLVTDAKGYYLFDGLVAGSYTVKIPQENWTGIVGEAKLGTAGGANSAVAGNKPLAGYNNSTGVTNAGAAYAAADNNKDHGIDNPTPATTGGIMSAAINLGVPTTGTGDTTETGNLPGTAPVSAVGDSKDNLTVDFGFYKLSVGTLLWKDSGAGGGTPNDGIRTAGESGVANATVQLVNSSNQVVAQTLTDAGGNYLFDQLTSLPAVGTTGVPNGNPIPPGTYTIRLPGGQSVLSSYVNSADPVGGAQPTADSRDNVVGTASSATDMNTTTIVLQANGVLPAGALANNATGVTDQPRMDIGLYQLPTYALGNRVWFDTNNNGVIDGAEYGIPGVKVQLLDTSNNVLQTLITDSKGYYLFDDLLAGNYVVKIPQENWTGLTTEANTGTAVGAISAVTGTKPLAGYNNSDNVTNVGAAYVAADNNKDHGIDNATPATTGGIMSNPIALGATTVGTGDTTELGASPGTAPVSTATDSKDNLTVDFGFYKLTVGNLIWKDNGIAIGTANNGVADGGEFGMPNVTVQLINNMNMVVAQVLTNATGNYLFDQLTTVPAVGTAGTATGNPIPTGTYTIRLPANQVQLANLFSSNETGTGQPTGDNRDNVVGTADTTNVLETTSILLTAVTGSLPAGALATNTTGVTNQPRMDIGLAQAATFAIGNRVWFDTNNDGVISAGETGIPGVKMQLLDSTNSVIQTLITDVSGFYLFDGLTPGTYTVKIPQENWTGIVGEANVGVSGAANSTTANGTKPLAGYNNSTTVVNAGATFVPGDNNKDHGIDNPTPATTGGIMSASITVGNATVGTGDTTEAGAPATTPPVSVATDAKDNQTIDFGFYKLTVGNLIWLDNGLGGGGVSNDGIVNGSEAGIGNVTVQLVNSSNQVVAQTVTTGLGAYSFDQLTTIPAVGTAGTGTGNPLPPDTYRVRLPANQSALAGLFSSTDPAGGGQPINDSRDNAAGTTASTSVINSNTIVLKAEGVLPAGALATLSNGTTSQPRMDLGFSPRYALGNRVWFDTDNNGVLDVTESGANGVLVELTTPAGLKLYRTSLTDGTPTTTVTAGLAIEATTANGGYYLFDDLTAATYRVRVASSNWSNVAGVLRGYANSSAVTNQSGAPTATQNNKDHGTDPALAADYPLNGVSSADVVLGAATTGSGDTGETGAAVGTPPISNAGDTNDNLTIDFGFYRLTLGNLVFSDSGASGGTYNDGIKQAGEPGIGQVTVRLMSGATVIAQARTDNSGNYIFDQGTSAPADGSPGVPNGQPILPGSYTVMIPQAVPAGINSSLVGSSSSPDPVTPLSANNQDNGPGTALATAGNITTAAITLGANTGTGVVVTTTTGTTDQPRIDFGFTPSYALGNRVWFDTNNNGVMDAGEVGVPGVKVQLLDSVSAVVQTLITDANGFYLFDNLGAASFTVKIPQENWTGIVGEAPLGKTGAANSTAASGTKPLAGYSNSSNVTNVGGTFSALDNNKDHGIDNATPATTDGIMSGVINLGPLTTGLSDTTEIGAGVSPTSNAGDFTDNLTVDFGFYKLSVGDTVFKDDGNAGAVPANINNGLFDAGEAGIPNVRVELYKAGTLVAITYTDAAGLYSFDQQTGTVANPNSGVTNLATANLAKNGNPLLPGTDYQVRIPQATATVNPSLLNLLSSAPNATSESTPLGAITNDDSGVGTAAAKDAVTSSVDFTLGAGAAAGSNSTPTNSNGLTAQPNVDFGFTPSYSLGNRVWIDTDNNGMLNNAEVGLPGVLVTLLDSSNTPVPGVPVQTTDANGYYRFDNLPAGSYKVEIAPPAVGGVQYISSTGQNASLTGPFEPSTATTAVANNNKDHGTQQSPTTIRSGVVVLGPSNTVLTELEATQPTAASNAGPNGDAFDLLTVDFGVFLPASLGNLVWRDLNSNGRADPGEPGINGVTVILRDLMGVEIARQSTRNNPATSLPGFYEFTNLIPGQYQVQFVAVGLAATTTGTPAVTSGTPLTDPNNSQLPSGVSIGTTALVTLTSGDNNPQLDAGFNDVPPVPTLNQWLLLLLSLMVFGLAANRLKRAKL
jgi:SdrD B-like domain